MITSHTMIRTMQAGVAALVLFAGWRSATAQIELNVSVKIILDEHGDRPCNGDPNDSRCGRHTDEAIRHQFEDVSRQIEGLVDRGYSVRVVEIVDLDLNDYPPPVYCAEGSHAGRICDGSACCCEAGCVDEDYWFYTPKTLATHEALLHEAHKNKEDFAYRDDALNVYLINEKVGGICVCRSASGPDTDGLLLIGQNKTETVPAHEIGHYMGLCHTQGCTESSPGNLLVAGDEADSPTAISDTIPDNRCWDSLESIAMGNYGACRFGRFCSLMSAGECDQALGSFEGEGRPCLLVGGGVCIEKDCTDNRKPNLVAGSSREECMGDNEAYAGDGTWPDIYNSLSPERQRRVSDVFENLMSYHWNSGHKGLTPDQLDRWTDVANRIQTSFTTGRTYFVDASAASPGDGHRAAPFRWVQDGVGAATADSVTSIVLVRGGVYPASLVIDSPMTLRASRGRAVIGG